MRTHSMTLALIWGKSDPNADKGEGVKIRKFCGRHIWMLTRYNFTMIRNGRLRPPIIKSSSLAVCTLNASFGSNSRSGVTDSVISILSFLVGHFIFQLKLKQCRRLSHSVGQATFHSSHKIGPKLHPGGHRVEEPYGRGMSISPSEHNHIQTEHNHRHLSLQSRIRSDVYYLYGFT